MFITITTIYNSTTLQSAKLNLVQLGLSQITYKKQLKPKPKLKQKEKKKKKESEVGETYPLGGRLMQVT